MSVGYCMGQRKNGLEVGRACESCKAFAPPFALRLSRDLEAEGTLDEAEEVRRLGETLLKETGQDRSGHLKQRLTHPYVGAFWVGGCMAGGTGHL